MLAEKKFSVEPGNGSRLNIKFDINQDKTALSLLDQGVTVRYKFTFKVCKRRPYWIDRCNAPMIFIHKIQLDPISETFSVIRDRIGDGKPEEIISNIEQIEAFRLLAKVEGVDLNKLIGSSDIKDIISSKRTYLEMHLESSSYGESRSTLEMLSYLMTLGLVDIRHYDSGSERIYFANLATQGKFKW